MGYALLWLGALAASLLWVALILSCATWIRRRFFRWLSLLTGMLPPLAMLGGFVGLAAYLRYEAELTTGWLLPFSVLLACFLVGAIRLIWRGSRKSNAATTIAATWPVKKIATAFVVATALTMMTFWNLDTEARHQLINLRAETGTLALSAAPMRVLDKDNGAVLYEQAFEAMAVMGNERNIDDPDVAQYVKKQRPIISLLQHAAKKPGCFFYRDFGNLSYDMPMPEIQKMRQATRLLIVDARYKADQGDMNAALSSIETIFGMAQHLSAEPILVTSLVAMALDSIAVRTLEDVLNSHAMVDGNSLAFSIPSDIAYHRVFRRALSIEEAYGLSVFCQLGTGNDVMPLIAAIGDHTISKWPAKWSGSGAAYRVFMLQSDIDAYRSYMRRARELAGFSIYVTQKEWQRLSAESDRDKRGILTALLCPAVEACVRRAAKADATHAVAQIGLLMHRFQARHDRGPESLDELSREFFNRVLPTDPFSGKPLILKPVESGWDIYSIGLDMKDDGGVPTDPHNETGDIVFHVQNHNQN